MAESHWQEADRETFAAAWRPSSPRCPNSPTAPSTSSRGCCCRSGSGCRTSRPASIGSRPTPASASSAARSRPPGSRPRCWRRTALTPDDAFAALMDGRTILDLAEGLQLRRVRVMGANRIELSGFTDTMRDRLKAYGLFHEIISWKLRMFVPTDASGSACWRRCSNAIRSSASASGRPRDAARRFRTGAPSRARGRGGVPPLSLQWPARGPLLAGRRRPQHAGPLDVRPAQGLPKGPAGKWTDAATGEHGDLLDVIRESCGLRRLPRCRRRGTPLSEPASCRTAAGQKPVAPPRSAGSPEAARRLFAMSQPIAGTLVETYLRDRGIKALHEAGACGSIRAATIGRTSTRRPRPGRR